MPDLAARTSPLAHLCEGDGPAVSEGEGVHLAEKRHTAKFLLQIGPHLPAGLEAAVEAALGLSLPQTPNRAARAPSAPFTALWYTPQSWLILGEAGPSRPLPLTAEPCSGAFLTDVSDQFVHVCLSGPRARAFLAPGCPIDLHPDHFHCGMTARTLMAGVDILLIQTENTPCYELLWDSSLADYLWRWMSAAAGA